MCRMSFQRVRWKIEILIFIMVSTFPCFSDPPDITLPPLIPLGPGDPGVTPLPPPPVEPPPAEASAEASATVPVPGQEKIIEPPVPKNLIELYYPTVFTDYFGPAPWVISSTP